MRVSIILALCFLGVASAASFNKRSIADQLANNSYEVMKFLETADQEAKEKFENAVEKLMETSRDPMTFARGVMDILKEMTGQDRNKRALEDGFKVLAENIQQQLQAALEKVFGAEKASNEATSVSKREIIDFSTSNYELLKFLPPMDSETLQKIEDTFNSIFGNLDPSKLGQGLQKIFDQIYNQGRNKRELEDGFAVLAQNLQEQLQKAMETLFGAHVPWEETSSQTKTVSKRATNPLVLLTDLKDPAKFAQDLIKIMAEMALSQGKKKRDVAEDLKNFGQSFQQKIQEALKNLFGGNSVSEETATEAVVVSKRATNPLVLINDLKDPAKFAQDLMKIMAEMALQGRKKRDLAEDLKKFADAGKQRAQEALKNIMDLFNSFRNGGSSDETSTEKTISKRDINEDLQKLADAGKDKIQAALKQLQDLFEQFKGGFNQDQSSATVTKRDITETLKQFSESAQQKTQAAFNLVQQALQNFLNGFRPAEQSDDETSTEVSVSKRSISDFQERAQEALAGFRNSFQNFFNQFRKPAPEAVEDSTESS